jgi:5-methylcytosine-specific restriction endonuclease McrA
MALRPVDPVAAARTRRHEQSVEARRPRDRHDPYARRAWCTLRSVKLAAEPICESCGRTPANEVHHRNSNPWDNSWLNLVSLCKSCHSRTTAYERGLHRPSPAAFVTYR